MTPNSFLPIFQVSGTNYEIGQDIGHQFKDRIKSAFAQSVIYKYLLSQDELNPEWFNRLHDYAQKHYPNYVEEIKGIAEGANLEYRDVAIVNFRGSEYVESCSTTIFKNQSNNIIMAHNEDHEAILGELAYFLIVKLENGTIFGAYTYPGCISGFSFSFNSHGIVQTGNAMPDPEVKMGVPRHVLDRSMLEATSLDDVLRRAQISPRSGAFSFNLASMSEGRTVNLETTSENSYVTEVDDKYFHANHYISPAFQDIPIPHGSSLTRYNRGIELLPHAEKTAPEALEILWDDNVFLPIQTFSELRYGSRSGGTLCTALFEISSDEIQLRAYHPTRNKEDFLQLSLSDIE